MRFGFVKGFLHPMYDLLLKQFRNQPKEKKQDFIGSVMTVGTSKLVIASAPSLGTNIKYHLVGVFGRMANLGRPPQNIKLLDRQLYVCKTIAHTRSQ